jgi:hypothetical protein
VSSLRTIGGCARALLAGAVLLACATAAPAQTASAPALKAAFLFNFAKFTEWPPHALAPGAPLVFCVINDQDVGATLTALAKDRVIDQHALVVRVLKPDSTALASCGVLFSSGLSAARSRALYDSVAGKAILTVSDLDRFAETGGVAGFFVERGTVRFAINVDAAARAGITLSSKLLSLAKVVKDEHHASLR